MAARNATVHVVLPLVIGIAIYLLWRSTSLIVFEWLRLFGLLSPVLFSRDLAAPARTGHAV